MELARGAKKFIRLMLKKASRYPEEVQIEITNICNLDCLMCPRTSMKVPIKHMSLDLYETVLNKLVNPHIITLSGWGEPLCHPQFPFLIEKANMLFPSAQLKFTTNALLLTPEVTEKILDHEVFQINISLDQPEEDSGNFFHNLTMELRENIQFLVKYRNKRKHPIVRLQIVMQKNGWKALKELISFANKIGVDGINLIRLDTRWSELERPTWEEERDIINRARNLCRQAGMCLECINILSLTRKFASRFDKYCLLLDNYAYISVEGKVFPCCYLLHYKFGNLLEKSLEKIWHGLGFRQLRQKGYVKECESCDILKYHYSPLQEEKQKEVALLNKLT